MMRKAILGALIVAALAVLASVAYSEVCQGLCMDCKWSPSTQQWVCGGAHYSAFCSCKNQPPNYDDCDVSGWCDYMDPRNCL